MAYISGRDSADPIPLHERAGAPAISVSSSLPPYVTKTGLKAVGTAELLQWAYAREKVHLARPCGMDFGVRLRPRGFAAASSSERIGAAVGSSMNLGFEAPRDAYAVAEAVQGSGEAKLLWEYAMIGHAPDWAPDPVIRWEQGPPIYGRDGRGRSGRRIVGYAVAARGDLPAQIEARRRVYARWAAGIARVRKLLLDAQALTRHTLTDELPPLTPWV